MTKLLTKHFGNFALLTFTLALLGACASGPDIRTDYDHTVNGNVYKTYGFFNPMGIEGENYSTIFGQTFREAISREMNARGYTESATPDLLFNVHAQLEDKLQVTQTSGPAYGYYGYRTGFYQPWGGYGWNNQTYVSQYTQGTINIDMVDRVQKRMVWEGVAIGRVNPKLTNAELRQRIDSGVTQMWATYPFKPAQ